MADAPMKPAKAWAYVNKKTGKLVCITEATRKVAERFRNKDERLARVRITEVEEPKDA